MAKKESKSARIRHALSLKSNKDVSVADLAKSLKVKPGLIYAIKYKAQNGKAKKKKQSKKTNGADHPAADAPSIVVDGAATQPSGGTITQTLALVQEAAVVLQRLRAMIG